MSGFTQLLAALWVTQGWYDVYRDWLTSGSPRRRRFAQYSRTRAVVLYDRILNNENRGLT